MRRYRNTEMPSGEIPSKKSAKDLEDEFLGASVEASEHLGARIDTSGLLPASEHLGVRIDHSKLQKKKLPKTGKQLEEEMLGEYQPEKKKKERLPGRIVAFKPNEQFVSTQDADHLLKAKYEEIQNDVDDAISDRDKMILSGIPKDKAQQIFEVKMAEVQSEEKRMRLLDREVREADTSAAGKKAVYEGKEKRVNNPFFNTQVEMLAEVESGVKDEKPDIEGQRKELSVLMRDWKQLIGQMTNVRFKAGSAAEIKRSIALESAKRLEQPVHFPNMMEADMEKANMRHEYLRQAEDLEKQMKAEKSSSAVAEQMHYLLAELNELNVEIEDKKRNVEYLEKMYGKPEPSKAIRTLMEKTGQELKVEKGRKKEMENYWTAEDEKKRGRAAEAERVSKEKEAKWKEEKNKKNPPRRSAAA